MRPLRFPAKYPKLLRVPNAACLAQTASLQKLCRPFSTPAQPGPEASNSNKAHSQPSGNFQNMPKTYFQAPASPKTYFQPDSSQSPPTYSQVQPNAGRSYRPYIYAGLFFAFGYVWGSYIQSIVMPVTAHEPGSYKENALINILHAKADKLAIVNSLSKDPDWKSHSAYGGFADKEKDQRLTTGPLGGSGGLGGFQRVFLNNKTGECIIIIHMGRALAGWPGIVHGGASATVLDESLGRAAILRLPGKTGVTANLKIDYLKPVIAGQFYVIRTKALEEGASATKQWVTGTLETLDGVVCVTAKALFVVPKKYQTKRIEGL
ncbi:HotDog domain-containing protein [Bisporella sp. PMI_857]|nr:HotDog domain-containing protein [Bisporella sp. PMI_857]